MRHATAFSHTNPTNPITTIPFPGPKTTTETASLRQIALLGTFPPRQCGIATYTADVLKSVGRALPQASVFALAVSKSGIEYDYPAEVAFEIQDTAPASYREA
ncbi:MAG TPA: hypothetical protein VIY86_06080, partial [Pirellulaceae bacterium]